MQYSDANGVNELSTVWMWFNATFASNSANSCFLHYVPATNTLLLLNDAGVAWQSGIVGGGTSLQNSQCTVSLAASRTASTSVSLTLNLTMTFSSAFSGTKTVFMYAASLDGANSAWQTRGSWTVPGEAVVTADSATPNAGAGASQGFALQYSDTSGSEDLSTAWVWFNATFAGSTANSCFVYYDRAANLVFLMNDAGTQWLAGAAPGSLGVLQNRQCAIALSGTTATPTGSTLTLNLAMSFAAGFAGSKTVFLYAANASGVSSGWQTRGTWTVPGAAVVTADSATPNAGTGANQGFALQYSDTSGSGDLSTVWVWFSATFAGSTANSCFVYYDRTANLLFLLNDAGTEWLAGAAPGVIDALQNSQCGIALSRTTVTGTGSSLTLNLAMSFAAGFAGNKSIFMYAANAAGANSGWQTLGSWTVPPPVVTADAATPNAGLGATQTFALQYSDSAGAADLSTVWVWFHSEFASTTASSCLLQYATATSTLLLMNDAGTQWLPGAPPRSGGVLRNSQCGVLLSGTTATLSGSTLTLTLAMAFASGFVGPKHVYMYAANATGNSGWQARGTWTVPVVTAPSVVADTVTPIVGSGTSRAFGFQYSDSAGAYDFSSLWVWFSPSYSSSTVNSCLLQYVTSSNTLMLLDDAATTWLTGTLGEHAVLSNSQCTIALAQSGVGAQGPSLALSLEMVTFSRGFSGIKNVYTYAASATGSNSGWQLRGTWTVPGPMAPVIAGTDWYFAHGVSPTIQLDYLDAAGAADLSTVWVWFNDASGSTPANPFCLLQYAPATNTLMLMSDSGIWQAGTPGTPGTLQNSQCSVALIGSTAMMAGERLRLTLAMTALPTFSGTKNIVMYAAGGSGVNGWQTCGLWIIPVTTTPVVTSDGVSPAAGSGAAQTFTLQYSSSAGAGDVTFAEAWFAVGSPSSYDNTCLVAYVASINALVLSDDLYFVSQFGFLGTRATLRNSQCAVSVGDSSVTRRGNTLTLNLAMSFAGHGVTMTILTVAANPTVDTGGWRSVGTWSVP